MPIITLYVYLTGLPPDLAKNEFCFWELGVWVLKYIEINVSMARTRNKVNAVE